jgi:hypothetical protein
MAGKAGGILAILGALLMIGCVFLPMYIFAYAGSNGSSAAAAFFLNNHILSTGTGFGNASVVSGTYSDAHLTNTGNLYAEVTYITFGAIALGFLGGILALTSGGARKAGRGLVAIALILAIVAPIMLFALQPGALSNDHAIPGGGGPASSFFGSCAGSSCPGGGPAGSAATWGPSIGWYLSIIGIVLFLLGAALAGTPKVRAAPAAYMAQAPGAGAATPAAAANVCPNCGASFPTPDGLQQHIQSSHGSS